MDVPLFPNGDQASARLDLATSEMLFRRLFEDCPLGLAMLNPHRQFAITRVNSVLAQMLGYDEAELIGRSIVDLADASNRPIEDAVVQAVRSEPWTARVEQCFLRKDGEIVVAEVTAREIRDEHGEPLYAVAMIADLTERKRAEASEREVREAEIAVRIERARLEGVLLAGNLTADRLGNALSLTRGYNELILEQFDLPPRVREMLRESLLGLQLAIDHLRELQNVVRVITRETPLGPMLDVERSTQRDQVGAKGRGDARPVRTTKHTKGTRNPRNAKPRKGSTT